MYNLDFLKYKKSRMTTNPQTDHCVTLLSMRVTAHTRITLIAANNNREAHPPLQPTTPFFFGGTAGLRLIPPEQVCPHLSTLSHQFHISSTLLTHVTAG